MGRSKTPGVYQAADGGWEVDAWYKRGRIRKRGFASHAEAESYLIREKEARRKVVLLGERPATTLEAAAAHYIEVEGERGKVSLATEIYMLQPVVSLCGQVPLNMVSNQTLKPFVDARLAEGLKRKTVNNALSIVRRICNLAARDWRHENGMAWLETAPLITLLELSDQRPPRPISWVEQRTLLKKSPAHLAQMILFDTNTGVREDVVVNLRWEWEARVEIRPGLVVSVFVVPRRYVKGRKRERIIVCNSVAQSIVDAQRGLHEERVFTFFRAVKKPGKVPKHKATDSMNNTAWQNACEAAGLDIRLHDLRHTVGMRLREVGVSERTQDEILWHSKGTMTNHYAVAQVREIYDALELIRESTGHESVNVLALVRRQVPQNSPPQRKTA
ncbi:tyrosine-type recombinase/integrase [Ralstonia syzygii]|uniref:tyrosine-type recombinase/integrase n=1 Tax=Ralstonia syzygii TaxID=28097 RepID=UPI00351167E0